LNNSATATPTLQVFKKPHHFLAFGFGSGLAPKAPGTFGTVAAIPVFLLLSYLPLPLYCAAVVIAFIIGVYICNKTSEDLKVHDHSGIVWDEFVGFWITMTAIPVSWLNILYGFLLFRLFDVWKPFPIKLLDKKVKGGFGIMIDDVLAGIFAWAILYCWQVVYPSL